MCIGVGALRPVGWPFSIVQMLIDVHGHFGQATPGAAPPARVAVYAGTCGIDHVLVSNVDAASESVEAVDLDEVDANMACLDACKEHARLLPLYWVRLGQADSHVRAMAGALSSAPFVGALFAPSRNGFSVTDPRLDACLEVLAARGQAAVFCVCDDERATPAGVHSLARRHRGTPIVMCCCGTSESTRPLALDTIRRAIRDGDSDLYMDTSHASADEIIGWTRALGGERILLGTDAVCRGDAHIPHLIALLDRLRRKLQPDDFNMVTGGNAERLFGLGAPGER